MMTAKLFKSGSSQEIRIFREVQTDQKEFYMQCPADAGHGLLRIH